MIRLTALLVVCMAGCAALGPEVRHSSAELDRIATEIGDMQNEARAEWLTNYVTVQPDSHRVLVSIPREDRALVALLRGRYGDAIAFVIEPPPRPLVCLFPDAGGFDPDCHE